MVVASPLNLKKVTTSVNDSQKKVTEARSSVKNIGQVLFKRTKVKREAFAQTNLFRKRREENERRQTLEDELKAPSVVVRPGGPQQLIQATGVGGFFDRILGFIGYLSAGWIMNNLPTWIAMGKEFIVRLQRAGEIVSGFFNNTIKLFANVGNILGALGQNLMQFDFFDTSNRIKTAMSDLNFTMGNLTGQIEEAFSLLTTPLTEGKYSGEQIPEVGTQQTNEGAYVEPPPYTGSGGGNKASAGSPEQRAMLDAIAFAEGTRDQPNGGYKTLFGFEQFDDYSRHPDRVVRKGRYASAAAGRYQFMPGTFNRLAKKLGLKDFSPKSQDLAALELAKELGITPEVLRREGMSQKVSALLGRQWASFPGKSIGLDQPTKKLKDVQKAYNISLGSPQQPSQATPSKGITPIVTGRFGEKRENRMHGGTDLAAPSGTPLRAVADGQIIETGWENGWGYFLVYKDTSGLYHLYGHMPKGSYKTSGPVKKGEVIGKVGSTGRSTGPHLHWEIGKSWNGTIGGKFDPLNLYNKNAPFSGKLTPDVQMAPPTQQSNMVPFSLTPERRGQDVMVIMPQQQQNIITPAAGGGDMGPSAISDFQLLNNFIKNKLLLDLAYL
jgi:murein DD-endopeptidase MepM/ murein hydrolase activator NlpD